jgi:8-oxo-dGTP diphosphatase
VVHVFQVTRWDGQPVESIEMKPAWFHIDQLPLSQMWQDASHWLPLILAGETIKMHFVFEDDNETVREVYKE